MPDLNFPGLEPLNDYVQDKSKGFILVTHRKCKDYEGMVLCIIIRFDIPQAKYELDLEWMSLGLDFYGDTLQESYMYQFESLEKLLEYLLAKYAIKVSAIPVKYSFDNNEFPNPIKDEERKPQFEAAWQRFQHDFKRGAFLDPSLKLVYASTGQ